MATSAAGATNLDWATRQLGPWTSAGLPDPVGAVAVAAAVQQDRRRAVNAPLFQPFLYGAPGGSPVGASWLAVRGWHDSADLLYAVLEGIVFNHRTHLAALHQAFSMDRPLRLCGGGARSETWSQLFADADRPCRGGDRH